MLRLIAAVSLLLFSLSGCSNDQSQTSDPLDYSPSYHRSSSTKDFDTVLEELLFAVSNENYNITSINRVGKAIAQRHDIEFPRYTIVNSCNLEMAKKFLDIDPKFVTVMPCRIAVWQEAELVHVSAHLLPETLENCQTLCKQTNDLLKRIVDFSVSDDLGL